MQHLDEGTIHAWLDGALSAEEAEQTQAHVAECAECAAAVRDARGFIAASSRILTALDDVPRAIPASTVASAGVASARQRGRFNRPAWRAAAAIVVVGLGSFIVLRDWRAPNDVKETAISNAGESAAIRARSAPSLPDTSVIATSPTAPLNSTAAKRAPATPSVTRENQLVTPDKGVTAGERRVMSSSVPAQAPSPQAFTPSTAAGGEIRVATQEPITRLRGAATALGGMRTVYEVAPGDTVVLMELPATRLTDVTTTTAGTAFSQMRRGSAADAKAPNATTNANAKTAAPPQAPSRDAASTPMASAGAVGQTLEASISGLNTLAWKDPATGSVMRLTGHHSLAELEEIRRRIEHTRATAAEKKSP
jgi:Putative zinc-finger